jgi:Spy/CpxP family protein refolding chaperone
MNKQILLVFFVFVVALGSGILLGMGVARTPRGPEGSSYIEQELKLTPQQREQMRGIWQGVLRQAGQHSWERRRELSKQREEAVMALLTPEQRKQYDALQEQYNQGLAVVSKEREAAYKMAVEKTKAMLTSAQAARYDEILAKGFHGPWRGPGGASSRPGEPPASRPATEPAGASPPAP